MKMNVDRKFAMTDKTNRIGIDIGGTKIEGVLVNDAGTVLSSCKAPSRPGEEQVVEDICKMVSALTTDSVPVGIGIPGQVNYLTGQVNNVVNLAIKQLDLAERVSSRTKSPVHVENDVNAAALGAASIVASELSEGSTVAFVNLGTGLAAGLVVSGAIEHGASGTLGEIGHLPVDPNGFQCPCGQRGCLETVASGGAVSKLWPSQNPPMPELIDKAAHGDHLAREIRGKVVHAIADTVQITMQAYDPSLVIIGGGMARTGQPLLDAIIAELDRRAADSPFVASLDMPGRLCLAPVNQPIGAIGAALAAM